MIDCADGAMVTDEAVIPYLDAAPVLERATHVDKRAESDTDVLPAVGIKRREQAESLVDILSCQFRHKVTQLRGSMVGVVDYRSQAERPLAQGVHDTVDGRTGLYQITR